MPDLASWISAGLSGVTLITVLAFTWKIASFVTKVNTYCNKVDSQEKRLNKHGEDIDELQNNVSALEAVTGLKHQR